jgi:hypothetical protein
MAHAAIFDVVVDTWSEGKNRKPVGITATCKGCGEKFHAVEAKAVGSGTFASYLGAIHLRCPKCGAEGPVHVRRLRT